jgi:signal recognition particle subunit SRP54
MAGRILQMGDVVSLVEKAQEAFDADAAKLLEKKVRKEGMDLEDFLAAMRQMQKLGPLREPAQAAARREHEDALKDAKMDPKRLKHVEAIVLSMTPAERKKPEIINGSRRARIAKGSRAPGERGERLLEQFREMQKMMKKMGGQAGKGGRMPCRRRMKTKSTCTTSSASMCSHTMASAWARCVTCTRPRRGC